MDQLGRNLEVAVRTQVVHPKLSRITHCEFGRRCIHHQRNFIPGRIEAQRQLAQIALRHHGQGKLRFGGERAQLFAGWRRRYVRRDRVQRRNNRLRRRARHRRRGGNRAYGRRLTGAAAPGQQQEDCQQRTEKRASAYLQWGRGWLIHRFPVENGGAAAPTQ